MFHFFFSHKDRKRSRKSNNMQRSEVNRPMFAMVCVNNVNRSAAAHVRLRAAGLRVSSYGAGRQVTFPGKTITDAHTFKFLTPYADMHCALQKEDEALFSRNGVLEILERDMPLKTAPERWQSLGNKQLLGIDVVVCLDYGMFLTVLEDLQMRIRLSFRAKQLHIICLDTADTPEEAASASERVLDLCQKLNVLSDELTEHFVKSIVEKFEKEHEVQMMYLGLHM